MPPVDNLMKKVMKQEDSKYYVDLKDMVKKHLSDKAYETFLKYESQIKLTDPPTDYGNFPPRTFKPWWLMIDDNNDDVWV